MSGRRRANAAAFAFAAPRALGAAAALAAAIALVELGEPAQGDGPAHPGLAVGVEVRSQGEFGVPARDVLGGRPIRAGAVPVRGRIALRNLTGMELGFALRAEYPAALGRSLIVELRHGRRSLYWGTLRGLRRTSRPLGTLRSGGERRLELRVLHPPGFSRPLGARRHDVVLHVRAVQP